ncbi:MAG: hypothetical protein K6347_04400 [Campylobacterales bacterium]
MRRWILALSVLAVISGSAWSITPDESVIFDEEERESFEQTKFAITAGTIWINAIGKFADGEYTLQETSIIPLETKNSYLVTLTFGMKKGAFSYSHEETIGLLYDGNKLWIKYMGKIYHYTVPSQIKTIDRREKEVIYKIERPSLNVQIGKMKLRFEFE